MNAKDLMIGDWVFDKILKSNAKVEALQPLTIRCDIHTEHHLYKEFDPVPLTPEILEANGFETIDHNNGFVDKVYFAHVDAVKRHKVGQGKLGSRRIRLTFFKDLKKVEHIDCYISGVSKRVIRGEIYFVHELQHSLRFCGLDEIADNFKIE